MSGIHVVKPGWLATVQDLGRFGGQHLGLGPAGAMDWMSCRVANLLVGNPESAAVLELMGPGAVFQAQADLLLAVVGCAVQIRGGSPVPAGRPILLRAGQRMSLCPTAGVFRSYLAVAGGFQVPRILGSASAHVALAGLMPKFAPLTAGAVLEVGCPGEWAQQWLAHLQASTHDTPAWGLTWALQPLPASRSTIRLLPGDPLLAAAYAKMCGQAFKVSPRSNRMGIRLEGPALSAEHGTGVSAGVCTGAIQLLPDGMPLVLMADRQTVGGYPVVACACHADLPRLAQAAPGQALVFRPIGLAEAHARSRMQEQSLSKLRMALAMRRPPH